jgi:hypothetical protein
LFVITRRLKRVFVLLVVGAGCGGGGGGGGGAGGGGAGSGGGGTGGGQPPPPACGSEPFTPPTGGQTFYVAPDGSDSAAGTMAAPFRSMERAADAAGGGDVVYLRGGVYKQAENVSASGDAGNPVVFMAYPGEQPILDGDGLGLGEKDSVLQLYEPRHVVVSGLEIRNSPGRGVQIIDGQDVVIRECTIHDVGQKALGLNGHDVVAERNVIYNAVMANRNSAASGGWASGVTTQLLEDGSHPTNIVFRGNLVHDVWGECIDALYVEGMTIVGNEFRDCFSVGIYLDTARSVRVEGNVIRAVNQAYRRNGGSGKLADGILMGSEAIDSAAPDFGAHDVVIANNIVLGTHTGIAWWDDDSNARASNTYQRVEIVSNVVWGTEEDAIMFDKVPSGRTAPSSVSLTNNILFGGVSIGDPAAWTMAANVFPDGVPSSASDASNVAADPQLGGPLAVGAPAEAFRPSPASPARGAGRPVASVPLDYACATRGTSATTIGAFE